MPVVVCHDKPPINIFLKIIFKLANFPCWIWILYNQAKPSSVGDLSGLANRTRGERTILLISKSNKIRNFRKIAKNWLVSCLVADFPRFAFGHFYLVQGVSDCEWTSRCYWDKLDYHEFRFIIAINIKSNTNYCKIIARYVQLIDSVRTKTELGRLSVRLGSVKNTQNDNSTVFVMITLK